MKRRVLAPSDLRPMVSGRRVRVGGRVRRQPRGGWQLADATDSIPVEGVDALEDGSLVVLDGLWQDGALEVEQVVDQHTVVASDSLSEPNRLLDRGVGRALMERARALRAVRGWFDDRGFVEVDTAQRVPSPGLDLHLDAYGTEGAFLITSPEYQMKRLLVGGLPRIYQMVHCFRAGERGDSHNSEFLMLEWYRAFAGIEDVIADTERLIALVAETLTGEPAVFRDGRRIDLSSFEQVTVLDAFHRYCGLDPDTTLRLAESDEDTYFRRLVEDVEPALAALEGGVVLRDFPAVHASLARRRADDPRLCERFEVYVAGVELCNGFGELTDVREQRERFARDRVARRSAGKPEYPIDGRFLRALEEGMPPSGGNALGLDRLIALCLGARRIADVMAFPDDWL
jgi:elongation factor P--(R)-beta-lysine ligase